MKPLLPELLGGAAMTLALEVAPRLEAAPYARGHAMTIMMMLIFAAQEADRAADVLYTENAALKALLKEAADLDLPEPVRTAARAAAAAPDPGLRVSALAALNADLRRDLITLHEAVEASPAPWAEALEARIWDLLRTGAAARALTLPAV